MLNRNWDASVQTWNWVRHAKGTGQQQNEYELVTVRVDYFTLPCSVQERTTFGGGGIGVSKSSQTRSNRV